MPPPPLLGPFVGFVDQTTAKIWLYQPYISDSKTLYVKVTSAGGGKVPAPAQLTLTKATWGTGIAQFSGLSPDTIYDYMIFEDEECSSKIDLDGLKTSDLHFRTLPKDTDIDRLDFLLMSCHNPTKMKSDEHNGFRMWTVIPQIIEDNEHLRFAILGGDQIYADDKEKDLMAARSVDACVSYYLDVYEEFWRDINYRKVLCSVPSVMMWDDHDIMDGWGSQISSFKGNSSTFKDEWLQMFKGAQTAFKFMQASRNPSPLIESGESFDFAFKVG